MNRRLIIRPEAESDLADAAIWYESHEPDLGSKFISEIYSAIARALRSPESLRVFAEIQKSVAFSLDDFPIAFSSSFGPIH